MQNQTQSKKNQVPPQATMNKYVSKLRSGQSESESTGPPSDSEDEVSTRELKSLIIKLTSKVEEFEEKMGVDLKELHADMSSFKACLNEHSTQINDIEKTVHGLVEQRLQERIERLEEHIRYQEARSRKYNLLFYGIQHKDEDTLKTIKDFFQNDLKLGKSTVEDMVIANAHRVPRKIEVPDAPDPIIVKFARMEEREMVYRARTQLPVTSKKSVRTDLPADLKRKRGALSQIAYTMRKKDKMQTRIIESPRDVKLKFRKTKEDEWTFYGEKPDTNE